MVLRFYFLVIDQNESLTIVRSFGKATLAVVLNLILLSFIHKQQLLLSSELLALLQSDEIPVSDESEPTGKYNMFNAIERDHSQIQTD